MVGGIRARVSYREPQQGQYVIEARIGPAERETVETLILLPAAPGEKSDPAPRIPRMAAEIRQMFKLSSDSNLLDIFAVKPLPKTDDYDGVCGLAKLFEYIRDDLVSGNLFQAGGRLIDANFRNQLLTVDDHLKTYRKDGTGLVIGGQREITDRLHKGVYSDAEKACLERVCIDK